MQKITILIIRSIHKAYKLLVSPLLGNNCKFYPFCSDYCLEALENHGFLNGFKLTLKRVLKCGPYSTGGYDPVPNLIVKSK